MGSKHVPPIMLGPVHAACAIRQGTVRSLVDQPSGNVASRGTDVISAHKKLTSEGASGSSRPNTACAFETKYFARLAEPI
jgi:hypothetical protein